MSKTTKENQMSHLMSHLSISTDHQHRMDGQTRIINERTNAYVTDAAGEVLTFPMPYDAQQWLERQWLASKGIQA